MLAIRKQDRVRYLVLLVLTCLATGCLNVVSAQADQSEKTWHELLRGSLFDDRPIEDGSALLDLAAPYRADDPALVPIGIRFLKPAASENRIKSLTLIVDENPVPVAATLTFSPDAPLGALETRLRVNSYSFIRVVAETEDGSLHMVKRYVKATGGCAAPAGRNHENALASMGQMRLRKFPQSSAPGDETEFQLQIRHPNYSGFQMDQLTGIFRPAHFVELIRISADGKLVMSIEGGISLSENPAVRFTYQSLGPKSVAAHIEDTEDNVFDKDWDTVKMTGG